MLHLSALGTVLLQQSSSDAGIFGGFVGGLIGLIFAVLVIAGMWKIFTKAGKPGWASLIPIYNLFVLLKIVGRPGWWLILFLIPFVNVVILILVNMDLAKSFGKSPFVWGFLLLTLLNAIGYILLGFGSATYQGPAAGRA